MKELEKNYISLCMYLISLVVERTLDIDTFVLIFTRVRSMTHGFSKIPEISQRISDDQGHHLRVVSDLFGDSDAYYTKWTLSGKSEPEINEENLRDRMKIAYVKLNEIYQDNPTI